MKTSEDSLKDLWDNIKCTNICIIGASEGEERQKTQIIAKSYPSMRKEKFKSRNHRVPNKINPKSNMLRHINKTDKK